jgi:glycosyltransferase involved in cell wall biosynthesis
MTRQPSVVYVVPDKVGGMMNIIAHLLAWRRPDGFATHAVLTHNHLHTDTRFGQPLACDTQTTFEYTLPVENLRSVMRRLARAIPPGPGVIVAGDLLDLAMLSVHDVGRAVVLILHGDHDYYYDLAVKHDAVVHAYVAYSRRMYERLLAYLPHRAPSIFHLPYGIPLPARVRQARPGPLRLVFSGRLENGAKGILDLPAIDAQLCARGVERAWTIIGSGPDEAALRAAWSGAASVQFLGMLTNDATVDHLADQDVFVLPTRAEGFPVALLEAMGAGVVPVVSAIESGVPEIVHAGETGFTPPVGDVAGFADAIAGLAADRARLDAMSAQCRRLVESRFDIRDRVADYQALYARYADLYRPLSPAAALQYGSRLDQPWIPNILVRGVRTAIRAGRRRARSQRRAS